MKRIVAFLFIACSLMAVGLGKSQDIFADAKSVTIVAGQGFEGENAQCFHSGGLYYISTSFANFKTIESEVSDIHGYVYHFDRGDNDSRFENLLDFAFTESEVEGMRVLTGYTSSYKDFRMVNGKKVNIQIAFTEEEVVVGLPLILTGF